MLSRPRNPPVKMFLPVGSFLFTHLGEENPHTLTPPHSHTLTRSHPHTPVEVEDEFHEAALEKWEVSLPARSCHLVNSEHGPGMYWRIDITQLELIGCGRDTHMTERKNTERQR